jgi:hypothetical protein
VVYRRYREFAQEAGVGRPKGFHDAVAALRVVLRELA